MAYGQSLDVITTSQWYIACNSIYLHWSWRSTN